MPLDTQHAIQQYLEQEDAKRKFNKPVPADDTVRPTTLNPDIASFLAAGADGASTYGFLRKGINYPAEHHTDENGMSYDIPALHMNSNMEDNALYAPLKGAPIKTGLAAAGTGISMMALAKLVGKKYPKIGAMLQGQMAGAQLGTAMNNISNDPRGGEGATFDDVATGIRRRR